MPIRKVVSIFFVLAVLSFVFVNCGVTHAQTSEYEYYLPSIQVEEPQASVAQELPPFPECLLMGRWGETLCQMLYIIALQIATTDEPPPPTPTPTPEPPANTFTIVAWGDGVDLGSCRINPGSQWCSLEIRFSEINTTVCPEPVGVSVDLIEGDRDVDAEDIWLEEGIMWAEVFPPDAYNGQQASDYRATAYCKE